MKYYNDHRSSHPVNTGPGMTKQSHRDECDINFIMQRYLRTGVVPGRPGEQLYEYAHSLDYHSVMTELVAANEAFEELPSNIRARFHNDPAEILDFLENPENLDEARNLGLVNRPPPEPDVPPVDPGEDVEQ